MRVFKWLGKSTPAETYDVAGIKINGTLESVGNVTSGAKVISTGDAEIGGKAAVTGNVESGAKVTSVGDAEIGGKVVSTGDIEAGANIKLSTDALILTGAAATRTAVRADGGDAAPIGSVYFSTDGGATTAPKVYFKIANATADADWERLVTAAAD